MLISLASYSTLTVVSMNPINKKQKVEELGQPHSEAGDCGANEGKEGLIDMTIHVLPFHTVHGILKARTLKWFAIPFSSGPHFFRILHHDMSILGGPT